MSRKKKNKESSGAQWFGKQTNNNTARIVNTYRNPFTNQPEFMPGETVKIDQNGKIIRNNTINDQWNNMSFSRVGNPFAVKPTITLPTVTAPAGDSTQQPTVQDEFRNYLVNLGKQKNGLGNVSTTPDFGSELDKIKDSFGSVPTVNERDTLDSAAAETADQRPYGEFRDWLGTLGEKVPKDYTNKHYEQTNATTFDSHYNNGKASKQFYGRGNIDLNSRIKLQNDDNTFSTEESFSVNIDGKEVLLPTIIDGKRVSQDEAIDYYKRTGKHLGIFDTPEEADRYAEWLHNRQDRYYGGIDARTKNESDQYLDLMGNVSGQKGKGPKQEPGENGNFSADLSTNKINNQEHQYTQQENDVIKLLRGEADAGQHLFMGGFNQDTEARRMQNADFAQEAMRTRERMIKEGTLFSQTRNYNDMNPQQLREAKNVYGGQRVAANVTGAMISTMKPEDEEVQRADALMELYPEDGEQFGWDIDEYNARKNSVRNDLISMFQDNTIFTTGEDPEKVRQWVWNKLGVGSYTEVTKNMTPEEKAAFDAKIDQAIFGSFTNTAGEQLHNAQSRERTAAGEIKKIDQIQKNRDAYAQNMGRGIGTNAGLAAIAGISGEEHRTGYVQEADVYDHSNDIYPASWTDEQIARQQEVTGPNFMLKEVEYKEGRYTLNADDIYSYANHGALWQSAVKDSEMMGKDHRITDMFGYAELMNDEELAVFNELYLNGNKDQAMAYFEGLRPTLNERGSYFEFLGHKEIATQTPGLSSVGTFFATAMQPGEALGTLVKGLMGDNSVKDGNSAHYAASRFKNNIRGIIASNIDDEFLQTLYTSGMSMGDNFVNAFITGGLAGTGWQEKVVLGLFATQAFESSMQQNLVETNGDWGQSLMLSTMDAVIETITEIWSVENLLSNPHNLITFFAKLGISEGSEEFAGNILRPAFQRILMGTDEIEQDADQIFNNGGYTNDQGEFVQVNSYDEAYRIAFGKYTHETIKEGLAGAASGILGGGVKGSTYYANRYAANRSVGRNVLAYQSNGQQIQQNNEQESQQRNAQQDRTQGIQELIGQGMEQEEGSESRKLAEQIQERVQKGKKVSNAKIGQLATALQQGMQEQLSSQARQSTEASIAEELQNKGLSEEDANRKASLVAEALSNEDGIDGLKKAERLELQQSAEGMEILDSLSGEEDSELGKKIEQRIQDDTQGTRESMAKLNRVAFTDNETVNRLNSQESVKENAGEMLATDEYVNENVENKEERTGAANEIIVDDRYVTPESMELVKEEGSGEDGGGLKLKMKVNGKEQTVSLSQVKSQNFTVATILQQAQTNEGIFSARFANKVLQENAAGKIENIGAFMRDAYMLRLNSAMGFEMPGTISMNAETARDLWLDSVDEERELRDKDLENRNSLGAGKGIATFNGVEFGTKEWNRMINDKESNLDRQTRDRMEAIGRIAKASGMRLEFKTSEQLAKEAKALKLTGAEESARAMQGNESKSGITVNIDAWHDMSTKEGQHMMVTFGHEMTHWLQRNSRQGYNQLQRYVLDQLRANNVNLGAAIQNKIIEYAGYGQKLNIHDAVSEIVAQSCDQILSNEAIARHIQENKPGLFNQIREFVKDLVARVKKATGGMSTQKSEYSQILKNTNELAKLYLGAYDEAISGKLAEIEANTPTAEKVKENASRMSYAQFDSAYMQAVKNGDRAAMRTIVDEAAKRNGYETVQAFHGTDAFGFTQFDMDASQQQIFVSYGTDLAGTYSRNKNVRAIADAKYETMDGEELAKLVTELSAETNEGVRVTYNPYENSFYSEEYDLGDPGSKPDFYEVTREKLIESIHAYEKFLNENVDEFDTTSMQYSPALLKNMSGLYNLYTRPGTQLVIDAGGAKWSKITSEAIIKAAGEGFKSDFPDGQVFKTREIAEWAKKHGYNSVRINNVLDFGWEGIGQEHEPGDIGIFFKETDVKSADLITYDDNGEIIKPSERFTDESRDLRHSLASKEARDYLSNWAKWHVSSLMTDQHKILQKYVINTRNLDMDSELKLSETRLGGIVLDEETLKGIKRKDLKLLQNMEREAEKWRNRQVEYMGLDENDLGVKYWNAWKKNRVDEMEEILMQKMQDVGGIIPFKAPELYFGHRNIKIANLIKQNNPEAIQIAAAEMAQLVPKNAVLVPMPPHTGKVTETTDTMVLAKAISELTKRPVMTALESDEHARRKENKGTTAADLGFRQTAEIPEGMIPYFIDNMIASGVTAQAAHDAIGHGITLAFAKSTRGGLEGLKYASPTFLESYGKPYGQWLIPLDARMDKETTAQNVKAAKFSMASNVEETRDLIAVHNMTKQNLLDTIREGGFTAPSIAVIKAKWGHSKYGPISVIFKKEAIDPQTNRKNKIYGADAWTPTRSNAWIESKLDFNVMQEARDTIQDLLNGEVAQQWSRDAVNWINNWYYEDATTSDLSDMTDRAYSNDGMIVAYQVARGNEIRMKEETVQKRDSLRQNETGLYNGFLEHLEQNGKLDEFMEDMEYMPGNEILRKYTDVFRESGEDAARIADAYKKNPEGIAKRVLYAKIKNARAFQEDGREIVTFNQPSKQATVDEIRNNLDKKDFADWIKSLVGNAFGKRGIRNGKDMFTSSGSRRSFEQTHMDPTVENIVKAMYMNHEAKGGEAGGATGLIAKASKEYRNLSEVKADSGRLEMIDEGKYSEIIKSLDEKIINFVSEVNDSTGWDFYTLKGMLIDAGGEYAKGGMAAVRRYFKSEGLDLTDEQIKQAVSIMDEAREVPTGYFEAKPERVNSFDEIAKVIIPEDTELQEALDSAGIPYEVYDGTEEDRKARLNSEENEQYRFSMAGKVKHSQETTENRINRINAAQNTALNNLNNFQNDDTGLKAKDFIKTFGTKDYPALEQWIHNRYEKGRNKGKNVSVSAVKEFIKKDIALLKRNVGDITSAWDKIKTKKPVGLDVTNEVTSNNVKLFVHDTCEKLFGNNKFVDVDVKDTKSVVRLNNDTINESYHYSREHGIPYTATQKVLNNAIKLLETAHYIGSRDNYIENSNDSQVHYYVNQTKDGGFIDAVVFCVHDAIDEDAGYDEKAYVAEIQLIEKENAPGAPPRQSTQENADQGVRELYPVAFSGKTIADILDAVNTDELRTFEKEKLKGKGLRMSYASRGGSIDVQTWMLGMTESNFETEGEKRLFRAFKDLKMQIDVTQMKNQGYLATIRRLNGKQKLTYDEREQLRKAKINLETGTAKLERLVDERNRITDSEGWAGMMFRQSRIIQDYASGKTHAQVMKTIQDLTHEIQKTRGELQRNAERLKTMAETQAVRTMKSYLNKTSLKSAAQNLRKEYGSRMSKGAVEAQLASISLKLASGENIMDDVTALAQELSEKIPGYGSEALERMKGTTFIIGKGQMAELKASHQTLKDLRARLRGSGIKVRALTAEEMKRGGNGNLESQWEEFRNYDQSLPELGYEKDQLENLVSWIESQMELNRGGSQYGLDLNGMMADIIASAGTVSSYIVEDPKAKAQIDSLMKDIRDISARAESSAAALEAMDDRFRELELAGVKAKGWTSVLQRDVKVAIQYYNETAKQAVQTERKKLKETIIAQLKSENAQKLMKQSEMYRERIANDKKTRQVRADNDHLKKQIETNVKRVSRMMTEETDLRNIPEQAKPLARKLVELLVRHDLFADHGMRITKTAKDNMARIAELLKKWDGQDGEFNAERDLDFLVVGEGDWADESIKMAAQDALLNIQNGLRDYDLSGGKGLETMRDWNEALQRVRDGVNTIYQIIQKTRNVDIEGRQVLATDAALDAAEEMGKSRFKGELVSRTGKAAKAGNMMDSIFLHGNATPIYFIKNLRNRVISQLFNGIKKGENQYGLETKKYQDRMAEIAAKHRYETWDQNKVHKITLGNGKTVSMTTENLMYLYATWKREQNTTTPEQSKHLTTGGMFLEEAEDVKGVQRQKVSQKAIRLTEADINSMISQLTEEQKNYADDVVRLMSTELAALGNEASMQMHGIRKFKESFYFPFKVWTGVQNVRSDAGSKGQADHRAAHPGFSNRRINNASNAIIIGDFTKTATEHIIGMINYSTMAPAIENMQKVLNANLNVGEGESQTTRKLYAAFQEAYGTQATKYMKDLMEDLNGGAVRDNTQTLQDFLLRVFKKNAVAGSMSVAAQQPLSYLRAALRLENKYLARALSPKYWKGSYEEMISHSGVAVIKNIGKFDMGMGQSGAEFILPERREDNKLKKVGQQISEKSTILPELADRMTWTRMWTACKLEQMDLHKDMDFSSDEFLDIVAERFNDLMRETQVYDSVLVKSRNMRSTNPWMKTATSFMAEPTLTANVLADAWLNRDQTGKKAVAVALTNFGLSAMLQAAVKGLFSAGRTPDKDKTLLENWINKFMYSFMSEINPLNMLPYYNDIVETFTNGEMKDDTFGVLGKVVSIQKTIRNMFEGKETVTYRVVEDSVGQMLQLATGVPLKNIMRDLRATANIITGGRIKELTGGEYAQRGSNWNVIKYSAIDQLNSNDLLGMMNAWLGDAGYNTSTSAYYKRIYEAQKAGDTKGAEEMTEYLKLGKGVTDKALNVGIKKSMTEDANASETEKADYMIESGLAGTKDYTLEQVAKGKIPEDEALRILKKDNPDADENDLWWAVDRAAYKRDTGAKEVSGNYYRLYGAIDTGDSKDITGAVKLMTQHGYTPDKIQKQIVTKYKTKYLEATGNEKVKLKNQLIMAFKATGMSGTEANEKINGWKPAKKKK